MYTHTQTHTQDYERQFICTVVEHCVTSQFCVIVHSRLTEIYYFSVCPVASSEMIIVKTLIFTHTHIYSETSLNRPFAGMI